MDRSDSFDQQGSCGGLLPILPDCEGSPALRSGEDGTWKTRSELREAALRLGTSLASQRKRLVFVFVASGPATIVSTLGAASSGHAIALVDSALAEPKLVALIDEFRPEYVLCADVNNLAWLLQRGYGAPSALDEGIFLFERTLPGASEAEIDPTLFLLLATSGTTGVPRFVRLSRAAVLANAVDIAEALNISSNSVGVAHLPIHYSFGWSVVASHLVKGAGVVTIAEFLMSKTFWPSIAEAGGTHFPGVPFHYTVMSRLGLNLIPDCVTTFTQAGGALDIATQTKMHDFAVSRGASFFVMYGQTEASPRMTTLPHTAFAKKAGSVGLPLASGRIGIERDGVPVGAGEVGDVVYTGPNVMLGYAERRDDLGKIDEMRSRLETGDVGYVDDEGFLFLTGRTKRFAKIAGLRLGLDQMEREFASAGAVACLDGGDKILVYYDTAAEVALKDRVRALAIEYKIPSSSFALKRISSIPHKSSGKVDYGQLKEVAGV